MDTVGHLLVTSRGNCWVLTAKCMHTYVFSIPFRRKLAENVAQAYLTGLFAHEGGSIAILSKNRIEFKTLHSMMHAANVASKEYFQTYFTSKATQESKTCTISSENTY